MLLGKKQLLSVWILCVYESVTTFNDGHIGKWILLKEIGIRPGKHFMDMMKPLDQRWIMEANKVQQELVKKIRKDKDTFKKF